MSMVITMIPMAVAIGVSLSSSAVMAVTSQKHKGGCDLDAVETIFCDGSLLVKTLAEHGLNVQQLGENEFVVETESGLLHFFRNSEEVPFSLEVKGVQDTDELFGALESFENEYGRNVQKFTYDNVLASLEEHGMSIQEEEILEDESILLTLSVS